MRRRVRLRFAEDRSAGGTSARLRRARSLLVYWRGGELVFENYATRVVVSAHPVTLSLLSFFESWRPAGAALRRFHEYSAESVKAGIGQLLRHTLLVAEGSAEARLDTRIEGDWAHWMPLGAAFHFGTKDTHFLSTARATPLMRAYLKESPQPPFFKTYPRAKKVALPAPSPAEDEFRRVLMARESRRHFTKQPVPLEALSNLLHYTWAVTGYLDTPLFGKLPHKTSPSGGARHPNEVYVVATRVEGLAPGIYHYDVRRHRLELVHRAVTPKRAMEYCVGQKHARDAAALFLMTAVFPRTMWKYREARSYRAVLLEAGHFCQTLCLLATQMGLGPFCTAALKDTLIENDLGIDGVRESILYVAGVGWPQPGTRH